MTSGQNTWCGAICCVCVLLCPSYQIRLSLVQLRAGSSSASGKMPPHQGSQAVCVRECKYLTWGDMVQRHRGDVVQAMGEWDECMRVGLWEEHASVTFVMVDVTLQTTPVKVE